MEQNPTHTYNSPGVYTITLTAEKNGCEMIQYQTIEVKATTSVSEVSSIDYSIISNEGSIMITLDNSLNKAFNISITSMNGQNVYNTTTNSNSRQIDTRSFAKGLYLVTIKTDSDQITDKVFVK
jgi:PKD repeat protein